MNPLKANRILGHAAMIRGRMPRAERVAISNVTIHGLRRTCGQVIARLSAPELSTSALLGHGAGMDTWVYTRHNRAPVQQAIGANGANIRVLLTVALAVKSKGAPLGVATHPGKAAWPYGRVTRGGKVSNQPSSPVTRYSPPLRDDSSTPIVNRLGE